MSVILCGCGSEVTDADGEEDTVVCLPINISVGTGWTVGLGEDREVAATGGDTRSAAYDADELHGVTEARIFVFRRPSGSGEGEPFRYDPANYLVIPLAASDYGIDATGVDGRGTLLMRPGFEYRVMALSYSTDRVSAYAGIYYEGSCDKFSLRTLDNDLLRFYVPIEPEMTLEDFRALVKMAEIQYEASDWIDFLDGKDGYHNPDNFINEPYANTSVLSRYAADMPHLFYCECFIERQGERITVFSVPADVADAGDEGRTDASGSLTGTVIKGILRGGMAKVSIRLENINNHNTRYGAGTTKWVALMGDNVKSECSLGGIGKDPVSEEAIPTGQYTCLGYSNKEGETVELDAYVWPGPTHLALRVRFDIDRSSRTVYIGNYLLSPADDSSIDPSSGKEIVNTKEGVFYLRANHKYVINVQNPETELFNHELR